jgi:hypothetical protein
MKQSESIIKIAPAFLKAQQEMSKVSKGAANPFFKSKYADLASVMEAVKGPLNDNGISYLQPTKSAGGHAIVETVLLHSSGEWLSEELSVPIVKQDPQGVGSALSYGKRYGLQSICGLPAADDDGNAACRQTAAPSRDSDKPFEVDLAKVPSAKKDVSGMIAVVFPDAGKVLKTNNAQIIKEITAGRQDGCRAFVYPGKNGTIEKIEVLSAQPQ